MSSHFLSLPHEVLQVISEFLMSSLLSHVCQHTWSLLRFQHLRIALEHCHTVPPLIWTCGQVHSVYLTSQHLLHEGILDTFTQQLQCTASLHTLNLVLDGSLSLHGVCWLSPLAGCRRLQRLVLSLRGNSLGPKDLTLVMQVQSCLPLHALHLDLADNMLAGCWTDILHSWPFNENLQVLRLGISNNFLTTSDVEAMASLHHCTHLRHIDLDLSHNQLVAGSAVPLQALSRLPALQAVSLDLAGNELQDEDAIALSVFHRSSHLRTLTLNFLMNRIETEGACALGGLIEQPMIQRLSLDVSHQALGSLAVASLLAMAKSTSLSSLHLRLHRIQPSSCSPLDGVRPGIALAPGNSLSHPDMHWASDSGAALETLHLDISHNGRLWGATLPLPIGHGFPVLRSLNLNLYRTPLGDQGSVVVGHWISGLPSLQTVTLNLSFTDLTTNGLENVLAAFQHSGIQSIDLDLHGNQLGSGTSRAIVKLLQIASLVKLKANLAWNPLPTVDLEELSDAQHNPKVQALELGHVVPCMRHVEPVDLRATAFRWVDATTA